MSTAQTSSKRPHERNPAELNGRAKLHKTGSFSKFSPGTTVFRLLCPASKIDNIIEKDGYIISQIQQETGVKIDVEDTVPGCDERVIVVSSTEPAEEETEVDTEQSKEDGGQEVNVADGEEKRENDGNDVDKESDHTKDPISKKENSSVQKALLLIFERMLEAMPQMDGVSEESDKSSAVTLRLLVLSSQVGCLLGKAGSVIKQISGESGAQIRIFPRDKLPQCATSSDELVQISGETDMVRKALQSVCQQLLENLPQEHDSFSPNPVGQSSHLFGPRPEQPPPNHSFSSQGAAYPVGPRDFDFHSSLPPTHGRMMPSPDMLMYRLLCLDEKVGGVIGKGGAIIKAIQQETGCEIKVMDGIADSQDRVIVISGPAHPDDRISGAQDAVLRVHNRIIRGAPDGKDKTVTARLLVSSTQIGCLLGKGGSIIAEMRKSSGAHIRIMGKDQVPKCASEGEEVVQINGEHETVQDALLQITTRLRHHFFRDAFPSINHHPPNPPFMDQVPPYMGRREFSPPGLGPFHHFDAFGGPPPYGGFHPHDDVPPFRPGMAPHMLGRKPWGPQGFGGGPMGMPDFAGAPHRRISGFGSGSQPAIITSTTVEVVVPRNLVPVIYGEDGACLKQIRQISDAKVTITDPKPGAVETRIIISGTPEQTHAAQSLIQAFVMSETESA